MPTVSNYTRPQCPCRECVRHRLTYGTRTFDKDGYCRDGYDRDGYDRDGYDIDLFGRDGWNADGYNRDGYDRDGYNEAGFNREGYDAEGYDADGYDEDGEDRNGNREEEEEEEDPIDDGSCCHSPQMKFSIRNDGEEPLAAGTRTTISLPAGTISAEGLAAIQRYLLRVLRYSPNEYLAYELDQLGDEWQTKTGNYAKRLSSLAYKTRKVKLSPENLSEIGTIARNHSNAVDVAIEITRDLNQHPGYFYHSDSCWWGSYYESRCALKTNGGFGLLAFSETSPNAYTYNSVGVSGRAWVMPLRQDRGRIVTQLVPTFDTRTPDAFVVFNGYGDLGGYTAPRILAHMAGWTYRKIGFEASPMYVNSLSGYLVTREEIAERYTNGNLRLGISQHASLWEDERNSRAERKAARTAAEKTANAVA
jgi:hypothetical protein